MNITKNNIFPITTEILQEIEKCQFFTLDLEFSGLKSSLQCFPTDSPEEHFEKRKEIV